MGDRSGPKVVERVAPLKCAVFHATKFSIESLRETQSAFPLAAMDQEADAGEAE
jgi:hypothetical protein